MRTPIMVMVSALLPSASASKAEVKPQNAVIHSNGARVLFLETSNQAGRKSDLPSQYEALLSQLGKLGFRTIGTISTARRPRLRHYCQNWAFLR